MQRRAAAGPCPPLLARTLPIWNTTGAVDVPGLRRAIQMRVEIGSLDERLHADALVNVRGLARQPA